MIRETSVKRGENRYIAEQILAVREEGKQEGIEQNAGYIVADKYVPTHSITGYNRLPHASSRAGRSTSFS